MKVLKFGGSSVSSPERIEAVIDIIKPYLSGDVCIVVSAFGGVTDRLIRVSDQALNGDSGYRETIDELQNRHLTAVRQLIGVKRQGSILAQVKIMINELEDVLHGVFLVKERTPRTLDYIMSFGERLSAFIVAQAMSDRGIAAEYLDARHLIRTDHEYGHARVDFQQTNKLIVDHFKHHTDLQVITGFIASSDSGETTTLGRSGSDYTAAIFAGALRAKALEIWTDVDGMMTADPRLVRKAFTVRSMSYEEAMELSHFGARVIFPATMQPAMVNRIPILIKNTFNPAFPGTVIHAESVNSKVIKGISSMDGVSLLNVQGSGLLGVVGASMRLFAALARENINVILISQASSEHSICIAVESNAARRAKTAIEKEFLNEIRNEEIDQVRLEPDLAIVAVVGEGMKHSPGTSGRMFGALGRNGINVMAIAQGSSERNISAVVSQADVAKALNALHEAFFLSDRKVLNLFLAGTGLIGGTLLRMIRNQHRRLSQENHLEFNIAGVANSKRMLFNEDGLSLEHCVENMKADGEAMDMQLFVNRMIELNLPNSIFVDCTSSEELTEYYESILAASISIVTPNKKANSGSQEKYRRLKQTAFASGATFLFETNVGAGLPVINTMNDLLLSGDKVIGIEAVLSGTLNYIFSSFREGLRFSEVVKRAKALGYTEPDPRDDLSGMDVARKMLILSREAGHELELSDVYVQNLVPRDCAGNLSGEEFLKRMESHDDTFERLRADAEKRNERLRYKAVLAQGKVNVELGTVGPHHPFYALEGSDNIILLTTERYHDRPMVIRGPGAGADVTAAGVFADIIRIGHYGR